MLTKLRPMKTILTLLFLCLMNLSYAQLELNTTAKKSTPIVTPSNHERYGHDYILTDYTFVNGDSMILFKLNIEDLEVLRLEFEDIVVVEENTLMNVTLFARNAIKHNSNIHGLIEEE